MKDLEVPTKRGVLLDGVLFGGEKITHTGAPIIRLNSECSPAKCVSCNMCYLHTCA